VLHFALHFRYVYVVSDSADSGYRFLRDLSGRTLWTEVEGGGLPAPVKVIADRAPDGRYMITGLTIGDGTMGEITSATLRQIRLSEILAAYFDWHEPIWQMETWAAETSVPLRPRSRGPDGGALLDFARTYLAELGRQPHRAMTAAARAHNISRATANRWAATCREIGLLPAGSAAGSPGSDRTRYAVPAALPAPTGPRSTAVAQ
jgi:hypothetical protein